MHEEIEDIDHSTLSANEFYTKSDEVVPKQKKHDPIDFQIVTRIPEKDYRFQWVIRQYSTLSPNIALYSTDIHILDTTRYRLKLVKYENGFGLFHVSKEKSDETRKENEMEAVNRENESRVTYSSVQTFTFGHDKHAPSAKGTVPDAKTNVSDGFTFKTAYQICTSDSMGKDLTKWSVCFSDNSKSQSYKIGEYMNNTSEAFPNDTLILDCNLKVTLIPKTEEIPFAFKPSLQSNGWKKLSMDLKALYQNSLDTDVTLVVGTDKIHAHKLILTARSPVFKKIFHHNMEETEQNSVSITDVQFSALQRLVGFLYSGIILDGEEDMNLQELYDLYYAADKYEVIDLREMAANSLLGRIQVDSASDILVWADRHNDKDLKSKIMNFIQLNFEVVSNMDSWESCAFHYPRLAAEVVNFCAKKLKSS